MLNTIRAFPRNHPNLTLILAFVLLFVLAQIFLGTTATPLDSAQHFQAELTNGTPAIVEFYSNL